MENNSSLINFYDVLQCDKTASAEELKKRYLRLLLSSHPDKSDTNEDNFLLIQKAWSVLRNPESRKQYDASLTCEEHNELLLYDTIQFMDMAYDEVNKLYTYSCRCGGLYFLNQNEFVSNSIIIGCDECSFSIQVNR